MRLLLISATGSPYFEHAKREMADFLGASRVLGFISAANLFSEADYFRAMEERLTKAAPRIARELVHIRWDFRGREALEKVDAVLVGGGNTYALLKRMKESGLLETLRRKVVDEGLPYMGSSAGANIAGPNILTTNDWNVVGLTHFQSLALVPFNLNPHYLERSPSDAQNSETRDQRIREYVQLWENPVVALDEAAILRVENGITAVRGEGNVKVFTRNESPRWVAADEFLEFDYAATST